MSNEPSLTSTLPSAWVERIFSVMSGLYGSRFADAWRGTDTDEVKALWSRKLARFGEHPDCIGYALSMLDHVKFPPTLPEFMELCREGLRSIQSRMQRLSAPPMTLEERERADAASKLFKGFMDRPHDFFAWARKPPENWQGRRAWEDSLYDAIKRGAPNLTPIVRQHVDDGTITDRNIVEFFYPAGK